MDNAQYYDSLVSFYVGNCEIPEQTVTMSKEEKEVKEIT
jgi:hypothetical protein